jgi:hypothetical protein
MTRTDGSKLDLPVLPSRGVAADEVDQGQAARGLRPLQR